MITEIDIKDYSEVSNHKLYDVPLDTICRIKGNDLWFKPVKINGNFFNCKHLDRVSGSVFELTNDIFGLSALAEVTTYSKPKNEKG